MTVIQIQDPISKNHSEFISRCLTMAEQSPTSEMKAMYAKTIYDYMTVQARTFVMERPQFKEDTIKKAYELKLECADFIDLENSLNYFLIVIGEPLEE